jgi:DNA processing protein
LSVVGTRRATSYGRDVCREIIMDLSQKIKDLVIVSGLAYGIDVIAHKAAIDAGIPTVAVLGHGFSTIYPSAHRDVARKIIRNGTLVTDFHSGMGPERNNFLRRNRIIAGMSNATLVVESASEGGALITANLAHSYDRDVLAVPGRRNDIRSRGCNELIKKCTAALTESAEDVMYHLNWNTDHPEPASSFNPQAAPAKEELQLLKLMIHEPGIKPETLSARSGIPVQQVLSILVRMELNKWIMVEPGYRYHCLITNI